MNLKFNFQESKHAKLTKTTESLNFVENNVDLNIANPP